MKRINSTEWCSPEMNRCEELIRRLPQSLQEGVESLALDEGTSLDELIILALAEKLARSEHAAWQAQQLSRNGSSRARERTHEALPQHGTILQGPEQPHLNLQQEIDDITQAEFFEDAPVCLAVLSGPDHVFTKANRSYRELVGHRELIGRRVVECIPEVAGTAWMDLLDGVYRTGRARAERGASLWLARAEGLPLEEKRVDYAYKPRRDADGTISGIIVLGVDTSLVQGVLQRLQ